MNNIESQIAAEFPEEPEPADRKKRCTRCEEWKPLDQFYKRWADVLKFSSLSSMCKPCYRATYRGEYRKSRAIAKQETVNVR